MAIRKISCGALLFLLTVSCTPPSPTGSCGINFCLPEGYKFADVQDRYGEFIYMALPGDGTGIIILETGNENWPLLGDPISDEVIGTPLPLPINAEAQLIPEEPEDGLAARVEMHFPDSRSPHVQLSGSCDTPSSCVIADFARQLRPRKVR